MKANIGDKIRKVTELKSFTQDYMAGKLEISQRAYSKIENNDIKLDWGRIEYSSKILDIEPFDLISFDDNLNEKLLVSFGLIIWMLLFFLFLRSSFYELNENKLKKT